MSVNEERNNYRAQLIQLVKDNPVIWNKDAHGFCNRATKAEVWKSISAALNVKSDKARRTWENLRDQYRRDYKRSMSTNIPSKWYFYKAMHFIKPMVRVQPNHSQSWSSGGDTDSKFGQQFDDNAEDASNLRRSQRTRNSLTDELGQGFIVENEALANDTPERTMITSSPLSMSSVDVKLFSDDDHNATTRDTNTPQVSTTSPTKRPLLQHQTDENPVPITLGPQNMNVTPPVDFQDEDFHFVMSILPSLRCIQGKARKLSLRMQFLNAISEALEQDVEEMR